MSSHLVASLTTRRAFHTSELSATDQFRSFMIQASKYQAPDFILQTFWLSKEFVS